MKILYLTVRERRPNRSNPTGKINGWKSILNTLRHYLRRPPHHQLAGARTQNSDRPLPQAS